MPNIIKRTERIAQHETTLATPATVAEAHLALVLAVMELEYAENGIEGLKESTWTTVLVDHAKSHGMKVSKEMLLENIETRKDTGKKGNFFTDLRDAITEMRTGLTLDHNIRVVDSYVA